MLTTDTISRISSLQCSKCSTFFSYDELRTFSDCCSKPLLACYEPDSYFSKSDLINRRLDMWRYAEMLPVLDERNIISLGEGMTPMIDLKKIGSTYELPNLTMKDESVNPTGSFKARGLSCAISKAKEFGITTCIIPTAGNAGGAMSAYCAKAGMRAIVVMPRHTPKVFKQECELYNAEVILEDGLISDCARRVATIKSIRECFDVSTFKEPYRLEGKKTMGYEIAEQMNWILPDVILYPTGGGTGLVGMWKAFHEMIQMGWIENKLPKMVAVQAQNCCPIVQTWKGFQQNATKYIGTPSVANGLAVPNPFAEDLILETLIQSKGLTLAVSETDMITAVKEVAREEGLLIAPEGGALLVALHKLVRNQFIQPEDRILLLNTGSGYKYLENIT